MGVATPCDSEQLSYLYGVQGESTVDGIHIVGGVDAVNAVDTPDVSGSDVSDYAS